MADLDPDLVDYVKQAEGFTPTAAWDYKQHSNGYGTKANYPFETIDKSEADKRLNTELGNAAAHVDNLGVQNMPPGIRNALTSLTYNAGPGWSNSGLGDAVRSGDWATAKQHFLQYNKAGGDVNPALVSRRNKEAMWFDGQNPLTGNYPINQAMAGVMGTQPTFNPQAPQQQPQAQPPMQEAMGGEGLLDRIGRNLRDPQVWGDTMVNMAPGLMSIANPSAGAAMMNQINKNRYIVSTDKLGRQRVFDVHRGRFVDEADVNPGVISPDKATMLANTPEAEAKRAALDQETSSKTLEELRQGAEGANLTHHLAKEGLKLIDDPHVYMGPGATTLSTAKGAALALPEGVRPDFLQGGSQTAELGKIFSQLQGAYLSSQKGVRFAGPELKFSGMANADLEKPKETNKQILQDYILRSEYGQKAFELGNRHMQQYGVIGPRFNQDLSELHKNSPVSELNAVQPTNAPVPPSPPPGGPMPGSAPVVSGGFVPGSLKLPKGVKSIQVIP